MEQIVDEVRGFIDESEVQMDRGRYGLEIIVRRRVMQLRQELDRRQTLPAWLQFARARQGSE